MRLVRNENGLPTIKISLSLDGTDPDRYSPAVEFEVGAGRVVLERFTVDPADLGIPPGFDPGWYRQDEPRFVLAPEVTNRLAEPARFAVRGHPALWLELASPIGYLAALPWEQMLLPYFLGTPILRIPDFALVPERGEGPIDIVLCISEPSDEPQPAASSLLSQFVGTRSLTASLEPTVHVFADLPTYRLLSDQWQNVPRVVLHEPREVVSPAGAGAPPGEARGQPVTDPWLAWLLDEMRDTTVEAVHFLTHGYVSGGQPAIAVSESPVRHDERLWARFIAPGQLAACLTQLGAWSVGFSSPPGNFSPLGLREFADSLARLRPGPVLHHDSDTGPPASWPAVIPDSGSALDLAYWSLFSGSLPRLGVGSFMYVHPRAVGLRVADKPDYAQSLVAQTLGPPPRHRVLQPWETVTRRFLEQSTAQLFPDQPGPTSAEQAAVGEGVSEALRFVNQVLGEHGGQPA